MESSAWIIAAFCVYLLEAALNVKGRKRAHPHRAIIHVVLLTLVATAAILYERGY